MNHLTKITFFIAALLLWNCRDEADEVTPRITQTVELKSDSSATISQEEVDTSKVSAPAQPSPTTPPAPSSTLRFNGAAEYQHANFQSMAYRVMTPAVYDSSKLYPLVIFLHGIDERGSDNEKQLKWGSDLFKSTDVYNRFHSFVIFPQCPAGFLWAQDTPMQLLKNLIDDFAEKNRVDKKRIYIAGLSMGAYGTYEMVARNPGLFAAAIAISGDGDVNRASVMARTDWRIYGGSKDPVVPAEKSEKMASALKNSGAAVALKIYPDANHAGSWIKAFAEPDFCSWLYSNSK